MKTFTYLIIFFGLLTYKTEAQNMSTASTKEQLPTFNDKNTTTTSNAKILWEFQSSTFPGSNTPECSGLDKDSFGEEIACMRFLVDKRYVEKEEVVPGDPTIRTKILKPEIYKAVRNIDKHFRKLFSNEASKNQVLENYKHILKVALSVLYAPNTIEFEKALSKERKNVVNQIGVFNQVKLL